MNIPRAVKRNFDFLKKYGFRRKRYHGVDEEFHYSNKNCVIEIYHSLSGSFDYQASDDEKNKETSNLFYALGIIISKEGKRTYILNCDLFEKNDLEFLKQELDGLDLEENFERAVRVAGSKSIPLEDALRVLSEFILKNIDRLL